MREHLTFYIGGQWVDPAQPKTIDVINPATEEVCGRVSAGSAADVDRAVAAAKQAFKTWRKTSREERLALLNRIVEAFQAGTPAVATDCGGVASFKALGLI